MVNCEETNYETILTHKMLKYQIMNTCNIESSMVGVEQWNECEVHLVFNLLYFTCTVKHHIASTSS